MTQEYKEDGFDISSVETKPKTTLFAIVDLQDLRILGLYDDEALVHLELEKLDNSLNYVVTVMTFQTVDMNTPIAIKD